MILYAVVGATGNVGQALLSLLCSKGVPASCIDAISSPRSHGKVISYGAETLTLQSLETFDFSKVGISFFAAGSAVSKEYAVKATQAGSTVIDKTSYFRLQEDIPLVIPEVNGFLLDQGLPLISVPNCVAVPLAMSLSPLLSVCDIQDITVSTYQSISGAGRNPLEQFKKEAFEVLEQKKEPSGENIAFNLRPFIGEMMDSGTTQEEEKIVLETQKILNFSCPIAVTCVRVPTFVGHALSVFVRTTDPVEKEKIISAWERTPGLCYKTVTPGEATGCDEVFVGRLRTYNHGFAFWAVTDNLRKGAALNAVQVAQYIVQRKLLKRAA